MLAGLQGAGKTTLAAKLALWLKEQGKTPMLVAADLQRPNAVQQLQVNGERVGVPVFAPEAGNGVGDPVAVARASVEEAKRKVHDVVIIDTAGRLGVDAELMQQAADIRDAVQPDEVLFVVDAMIGQDAVTTAQVFLDGVGYDGVVLTKLDGDARGGAALSIASITGKPVMFASAGEKMTDFDLFHPDRMASRILDMGDMLTLIEQAEKAFDQERGRSRRPRSSAPEGELHARGLPRADAADPQARLDVEDHGDAARDGAVPRPARQLRRARDRPHPGDHPVDDAGRARQPQDHRRVAPGPHRPRLRSPGLRRQPARRPLLRGAQDDEQMARGGGMPGMPGMPAMPGAGKRGKTKAQPKKGKGKRTSGNPAKAAQEAAAAKAAAAERPANPFGNDGEESTTRRPPRPSTCRRTSPSSSSEGPSGEVRAGRRRRQRRRLRARRLVEGPRRAARRLHERLLVGDTSYDVIVLVLEGGAKAGVRPGRDQHVVTVHAPRTATPRSSRRSPAVGSGVTRSC